ncbi:hypothetical protein TTHERM_00561390 (macronuclear) [Tetrahymena thermophila SB210]|uniref:Uncharacterized protein n=1 Tax=Tetrahymena thermophila (strain SB210) TaxID=312017 RepID=I7M0N8_TETTS|nr:hypothetical protein TTHERM_00561390 [Tetrahymena thermophila SB210]EAR89948.3 hypothetical protein TTHERM_00561390 [Tetrahymena thermophila SB210]|eukprot:XP_001010193.3 hypothetical protein TTHERM_00561390 [Tetrahymena thermophila SB210]
MKAQNTFMQVVKEYFPQHLATKVPQIKRIDGKNVPNPQNKKTRVKSDKLGMVIKSDLENKAILPIVMNTNPK